jgi:surfeit locus 1 family protein
LRCNTATTQGKAALTEPFKEVAEALEARNVPEKPRIAISFIVFMAVLTLLFAGLGTWQVLRLAEKEAIQARVAERVTAPPARLPRAAEWVGFDPAIWDFRRVILGGRFDYGQTVLVFTSLSEARGKASGPGYWVISPLRLDGGGIVLVNRGFIPADLKRLYADGGERREHSTVTGIARMSETVNAFTPGPDTANRIEWVRDVARLSAMIDPGEEPVAPVYVDQDATAPGAFPQGGETRLEFPNRHLGYAITWFSLMLLTPILTFIWARRQLRP